MKIELNDEFTAERTLKYNIYNVDGQLILILEGMYNNEIEICLEVDYNKFKEGLILLDKNIKNG